MEIGTVSPLRGQETQHFDRRHAMARPSPDAASGGFRYAAISTVGAGSLASAYKAIRGHEVSSMRADPASEGLGLSERARSGDVVTAMRTPVIASAAGIAGAMAAYGEVMAE